MRDGFEDKRTADQEQADQVRKIIAGVMLEDEKRKQERTQPMATDDEPTATIKSTSDTPHPASHHDSQSTSSTDGSKVSDSSCLKRNAPLSSAHNSQGPPLAVSITDTFESEIFGTFDPSPTTAVAIPDRTISLSKKPSRSSLRSISSLTPMPLSPPPDIPLPPVPNGNIVTDQSVRPWSSFARPQTSLNMSEDMAKKRALLLALEDDIAGESWHMATSPTTTTTTTTSTPYSFASSTQHHHDFSFSRRSSVGKLFDLVEVAEEAEEAPDHQASRLDPMAAAPTDPRNSVTLSDHSNRSISTTASNELTITTPEERCTFSGRDGLGGEIFEGAHHHHHDADPFTHFDLEETLFFKPSPRDTTLPPARATVD